MAAALVRQTERGWARRLLLAAAAVLASGVVSLPPSHAGEAARRGYHVVEQWCRTCHLRTTDAADADMAPPFEAIVLRPGRDRWYFQKFLLEDHFPMTTYRLFDSEKADVVAYLLALQEDAGRTD